ncbi:hypothetical protein RJ639_025565 [Escallonia herrerae]|uniref:RNase H type-1 domain-containing protein n=1 Tax=Escallonia herrerae TaxID=1293975 RepID=A0AA88RUB0_9ASTE|nr:hypothetical protein RJ639_025565 [Escallonia herrerae]
MAKFIDQNPQTFKPPVTLVREWHRQKYKNPVPRIGHQWTLAALTRSLASMDYRVAPGVTRQAPVSGSAVKICPLKTAECLGFESKISVPPIKQLEPMIVLAKNGVHQPLFSYLSFISRVRSCEDGSVKGQPGPGGGGGIIRDEYGAWVVGFDSQYWVYDSLTTELWGILQGLKIAWDKGKSFW